MKRKIALSLVLAIISVLLLTGCHPFIFWTSFAGYNGEKNASGVEDIYNNYVIKKYLDPEDIDTLLSKDNLRILKSKNAENFHEAVKKCRNLQDIGFEYSFEMTFNTSNTLISSVYDLDAMTYLLDNGADPNTADEDVTPLMFYANLGFKPHCDLLLEYGADINLAGKFGLKPIDCALLCGNDLEFIQYLVEKGATVDAYTLDAALYGNAGQGAVSLFKTLHYTKNFYNDEDAYCHYENVRYILQLLQKSGQPIDLDPALQASILGDSAEANTILTNSGEKISSEKVSIPVDMSEIEATTFGDISDTISSLLDKYNLSEIEDILDTDENKQLKHSIYLNQVLFYVAAFGSLKDIDNILENGPEQFLGIADGQGLKLIFVAIKYNNMENVKYLLELDDNQINEAMDYAVRSNNIEAAEYLIEKGGKLHESNAEEDPDYPINSLPLACLISPANKRLANCGLDSIISVEMSDQQSKQCIAMLEFLKQNNFIYSNSDLDEAVTYAAEHGEKRVLEYLLKTYGTPQFAINALDKAADVETIKLLQKYGANILQTNKGAEYIGSAADLGSYDKLQYFLNIGADTNSLDTEGKTPLYYAVKNGKLDMVKLLVDKGAQISAESLTDSEGNNMMANIISVNGSNSILDYLISKGYDINVQYKDGETPMTELVDECIASYEQEGEYNPVDLNPTFGALLWNWLKEGYSESEMGQRFDLAGFGNSEEFSEAWNELMHEKYLERIELLLKYKADPRIENARGKSAYDLANEKGFDDIVKLFEDAGYKNG